MQLPIPDDWNGQDTCKWSVCWPDSPKWLAILMGLIEMPNQGRFWDFDTGNFLALREQFRQIYDYNFNLGECIMSCNDTGLVDAFNNIATAISKVSVSIQSGGGGSVCCEQTIINQNGGIAGSTTQPGSGETVPIFGTQPPESVPTGTYPEGYTSEEEYKLDKCQVSNLVVDGYIQSLRNLGALGVFNYIALAGLIVLAVTGAIVFPPAFIPIAAAALGLLAVNVAILTQVANQVEADRDQWVCTLYNSESVEIAIGLVAELMDGIIATLQLAPGVGALVKQIALLLMNADTLNQLMKKTAHLNYPDADCSGCGCEFVIDVNGQLSRDGDTYTLLCNTQASFGLFFGGVTTGGGCCLEVNIISHTIVDPVTPGLGIGAFTRCDDTSYVFPPDEGPEAINGQCVKGFYFDSQEPCQVVFTAVPCP